jgi:plasmid stabilization system protein ParE
MTSRRLPKPTSLQFGFTSLSITRTQPNGVQQAIYDACKFVAESPLRGHARKDLTKRALRFWTLTRYPNYTIVYRPEAAPVQVVAVLHGKRDVKGILKARQQ